MKNFRLKFLVFSSVSLLSLGLFQNCAKIDYKEVAKQTEIVGSMDASSTENINDDFNQPGSNFNSHGNLDSDSDSLSDEQEIDIYHTNPNFFDSDGGGAGDSVEVASGLNPLDSTDDFKITKYCNNETRNGSEICSPSINENNDESP